MIRTVVRDDIVLLAVDLETTVFDTIRDATYQTAQIHRVVEVICARAFIRKVK